MTKQAAATLKIPLLNGEVWEIEAEIIGDLALHPQRHEPKAWSVTHVPTLNHINKAIPSDIAKNKKKLLAWMAKVQQDLPKDWLLMRKVTPEEIRTDPIRTEIVRKRIREHCLNTKI